MSSPLECKDCGQTFESGAAFSDHFERAKDSNAIKGCKKIKKA